MKSKNYLVAVVFMLAIGSAIASEYLAAPMGHTKLADVPAQFPADCVAQEECNGTQQLCKITIDHDADPATAQVQVQLYNEPGQGQITCGTELFRNP